MIHIREIENLKCQGNYKKAKEKIEKDLLKYTDDYRFYEELADICLYEGNIKKAEMAMSLAQKLNPDSATGTYLIGYINISKGNFVLGVKFLEKANTLFPNNAEILRNLGWGYNMLGEIKKGIIILKRALNLAPDDKLIMEDLGVALIGDGNTELGEFYLKKAGKEFKIQELRDIMKIK
ncbi:hypothetical protein KAZ01_04265 [Candidatus Gracilibacteria bacterium]|nr:hypothetical protein [Candidatus Gracilibacteria bacterium]